ncbi:Sua5/YciO/YrdC/YwlC family protein [Thermodesulfatator indicus DSM 15286]|uniref:Threonylcarbamoyl-AMP synthase n=1 Tax=Thermodesulfatator indicus (strain DSM 15286 / JCM 11887 / CIR29812) TaxID=667014 RepID=F8A8B9_THEID|nr:L-threonylcarbamoyladenylate synthase [Thermodesulfatator indicus]AEH43923.1 Sua5/YciO/YrdC/YwlC family protein [Thermodesulfatator indicus DSM 15286]
MPILKPTLDNIKKAAELLRAGDLVVFPTETVYGLGANVFDERAVTKIFELKRRPYFDPLIVHVADIAMAEVAVFDERARALAKRFWPGPLTLILPKKPKVPDIVTSGLSSVAIRMPAHEVALALIKECGFPLAAPSANPFGQLSPTRAEHVLSYFGEKLFILEGGECQVGLESTILDLTEKEPVLLRPGGVPMEALKEVLGEIKIKRKPEKPKAPGQLKSHYAPRTPLKIWQKNLEIKGKKIGFLAFSKAPEGKYEAVRILTPSGDLREAAANLFKYLHELDQMGLDLILVEPVPEEGLGLAIMDRLRKAEAAF